MIDSFITYDTNGDATESPGYLSKLRAEMFRQNNGMEAQNFGFAQPQNFHYMVEMMPRDSNFEAFTHTSTYSNPSTKDSPDHTPDTEDHSLEDDKGQFSKVPPIVRKGIRKYYEPILDGGVIYNYEDDPNEYRKARKRIQNRESATRVRNRKKNHVEILEDDITGLKQLNVELKSQNSALVAENNMLRKKIGQLEQAVARNNKDAMFEIAERRNPHIRHETDSMMQFTEMGKIDEDIELNQVPIDKYTRGTPNHKFKRHMALLGVFTLLLCVYGFLPKTEAGTVQLFASPRNIFSSNKANNTPMNSENKTLDSNSEQTNNFNDHSPPNNWGKDKSDSQFGNHEGNNGKFEDKSDHKQFGNHEGNNGKFEDNGNHESKNGKFEDNIPNNFEREPFQPGPGGRRHRGGRMGKNMHPPKGHHNRFRRFDEDKSQAYTISIFTAIEILVVLCYSLYLIYVAVSAYKMHVEKKRQNVARQNVVVSRPL